MDTSSLPQLRANTELSGIYKLNLRQKGEYLYIYLSFPISLDNCRLFQTTKKCHLGNNYVSIYLLQSTYYCCITSTSIYQPIYLGYSYHSGSYGPSNS